MTKKEYVKQMQNAAQMLVNFCTVLIKDLEDYEKSSTDSNAVLGRSKKTKKNENTGSTRKGV